MENKNIFFKSLFQLNLPQSIDLKSSSCYCSSYKNLILIFVNNNLYYKVKYCDDSYSNNNFVFEKISSYKNKTNNLQQKFCKCDFTNNYIYFITQNKNEVLFSNYLSFENNKETISILPGIIQKKKIKSISCGINSTLFLTYGGMVYSNNDSNKENQKLITNLLEYNIDQIFSGSQHYLCILLQTVRFRFFWVRHLPSSVDMPL